MFNKHAIFLSYDGTHYHGFQIQNDVMTVQGVIEKCLKSSHVESKMKRMIHSYTGRTDAGVSAIWQTVVILTDGDPHFREFRDCVNKEKGLLVWGLRERIQEDFHASRSALYRDYVYIDELDNFRCKDICSLLRLTYEIKAKTDFSFLYKDWRDPPQKARMIRIYHLRLIRTGQSILLHVRGEGFVWNFIRRLADFLRKYSCGASLIYHIREWTPGAAEPERLFLVGAKYNVVPKLLVDVNEIIDRTFSFYRGFSYTLSTLKEFLAKDPIVYSPYSIL